jgi:hypothetical protein
MTTSIAIPSRKVCSSPHHRGARWLPAVYFHVYAWTDESKSIPRRLQSWCQTCQRLHTRLRDGHKPRTNKLRVKTGDNGYEPQTEGERERYREYQRQRYAGWTDEKKEDRREYQRFMLEAKRREAGIEPRQMKRLKSELPRRNISTAFTEPLLDPAPLGEFLKKHLKSTSIHAMEHRGRVNKRKLEAIISCAGEVTSYPIQARLGLELADRILTGLDCTYLLYVLYPQED